MAQQRQMDAIGQRADNYETDAGRELCQRAAPRIRALRDRDAITNGGTVADSGGETAAESAYTYHTKPPPGRESIRPVARLPARTPR